MLVACNDFVLVKFHDAKKVTDGGIILPDTANPRESKKATVIAVGPLVKEQNNLHVGDVVVLLNSYGPCFVVDGDEFAAVRETDIVCYVKKT